MNYDEKYQILIIGDSTVGKTSILSMYTKGTFNQNYLATVGVDNFTKDEKIDNKTIRVKIWDTAGQEKYKSLTASYFRNTQGVIIVYDVTNAETFDNLKYWIQSIKTNMESQMENLPIIIIGNKIDVENREVQFYDAESFSKSYNYPYFETSAKTGENVEESVLFLVKKIMNVRTGMKEQENKNLKLDFSNNNGEEKKCAC